MNHKKRREKKKYKQKKLNMILYNVQVQVIWFHFTMSKSLTLRFSNCKDDQF